MDPRCQEHFQNNIKNCCPSDDTPQKKQGKRRYQTSPALCNPTTPSRPIGRIACAQKFSEYYLHLPGILNDPFCCMMLLAIKWLLLQQRLQQCYSEHCSILPMLLNGLDNPRKLPLPLGGSATPSNTRFLGPTQVFIQKGISIGSAVFA